MLDIEYNSCYNVFIIRNVFPEEENKKIHDEIIKNKDRFGDALVGLSVHPSVVDKKIRSNTVAYYDDIYNGRRMDSPLLSNIDGLFTCKDFSCMMATSPYPLHMFQNTNYHETQVSRYGDDNQHYDWHVDNGNNIQRLVTFVYYPTDGNWSGGEIELSNTPVWKGKSFSEETLKIKPEKNLGIIFPSNMPHRVLPTKSSKKFEDGRFSVNCWVGIK